MITARIHAQSAIDGLKALSWISRIRRSNACRSVAYETVALLEITDRFSAHILTKAQSYVHVLSALEGGLYAALGLISGSQDGLIANAERHGPGRAFEVVTEYLDAFHWIGGHTNRAQAHVRSLVQTLQATRVELQELRATLSCAYHT